MFSPLHAMKAYRGSGPWTPIIHTLGTKIDMTGELQTPASFTPGKNQSTYGIGG